MTAVLHAEVTGTGPPLLALHGFTGNVGALTPIIGPLSERHTVVAVDLPGHGRTGAVEQPTDYRFDDTVDSVAAVLIVSVTTGSMWSATRWGDGLASAWPSDTRIG